VQLTNGPKLEKNTIADKINIMAQNSKLNNALYTHLQQIYITMLPSENIALRWNRKLKQL
jgi:hypothetical protein